MNTRGKLPGTLFTGSHTLEERGEPRRILQCVLDRAQPLPVEPQATGAGAHLFCPSPPPPCLPVIDGLDLLKKEHPGARDGIRYLEAEFKKGNR